MKHETEASDCARPMTVAETEWEKQKIRLVQVAYTSEWAVTKFFSALFNHEHGLAEKYVLKAIAGGERDRAEAWRRMIKEAEQRLGKVKQQNGSGKNELNDLITMLTLASKEDIKYFPFDRKGNTLPEHIYRDDFCDAVVIHSANPSHLNYIRYALKHGLHVLCEKPLVPVIDSQGMATRCDLDELARINDERLKKNNDARERYYGRKYVVAMDAEHYSAKRAARLFFEHIGHLIAEHGMIAKVEGHIDEIDNPEGERTRSILSLENRTGLLADTGIHLMNIVTALGGVLDRVESAEYGAYHGYDVETSARVAFKVRDNQKGVFDGTVPAVFSVAKFVDRMKTPRPEKKGISFTFQNGQTVIVDFKKGTVMDKDNRGWGGYFGSEAPSNEYAAVLLYFHDAIKGRKEPQTSFAASVNALDALYRIYAAFPVKENCNNEIYP